MKIRVNYVSVIVGVTLAILLGAGIIAATNKNSAIVQSQPISFAPYVGKGHRARAVGVTEVKSHVKKGITEIEIRNRSSHQITAVTLGWYLVEAGNPQSIIAQGETESIILDEQLETKSFGRISFPLMSLTKVRGILSSFPPNGAYIVRVAITGAQASDGKTWRAKPITDLDPEKSSNLNFTFGCADQICAVVGDHLSCGSGTGTNCSNASDANSCTNTMCEKKKDTEVELDDFSN